MHFTTFLSRQVSLKLKPIHLISLTGVLLLNLPCALADVTQNTTSNTGMNNGVFNGVGNGINGSADGSVINSTNTSVQTGANQNTNSNTVVTPTQAVSSGGSSALVLPRNPLALPNAGLGRSNFGLQFGVNNNPGFSNMFGQGAGSALGWFMQGGVTIPFGKIPDIIANPRSAQLDENRQQRMENERQVFGSTQAQPQATVQGKVVSLNAYNYSTAPSPKIGSLQEALTQVEGKALTIPKVLALSDTEVFNKPLGKGEKIGSLLTGDEYRYIGHTKTGWVKLILPNGKEGWAKGQFEYLKNDYTELDEITLNNTAENAHHASEPLPRSKTRLSAQATHQRIR